jgi:MFS family permease
VLGLLIGGLFVEWASWRWVFRFVALVTLPVASAVAVLVPPALRAPDRLSARERVARLDLVGVSILTGAPTRATEGGVRR